MGARTLRDGLSGLLRASGVYGISRLVRIFQAFEEVLYGTSPYEKTLGMSGWDKPIRSMIVNFMNCFSEMLLKTIIKGS